MLMCFILAGYTVLNQTIKFLMNEDSSSVNYKPINANPKYDYPTYSFCFTSTSWSTLQDKFEQLLITKYAINAKYWNQLLKGKHIGKRRWKTNLKYDDFSHVDYNDFTFEFESFLETFSDSAIKLETKDENQSRKYGASDKQNETWPFFLNYKDPDTICFTRKNEDKLKLLRTNDMIWMDMKYFKHAKVLLHVYLHHTGQLTRSLGNPHLKIYASELHDWNSKITLKINHVSILRKRENSKIPCDKNLANDDEKFRKELIKMVGCVPIYWTPLDTDDNHTKICRTSEEMSKIYHYLTNKEKIWSLYDQPCNYMKVSVETIQQPNYQRYILLHFAYMIESFEEYVNHREFGIEGLGAGIGGYVGIFLGYSFLQIPSTMNDLWIWLKRLKTKCHMKEK